jgi:hypothetical protein
MQTRSARLTGRKRAAGLAAAVALGLGTALFGASPAMAAAPTLDQPSAPTGYSYVTLTGTADPGTTVVLWEAAYAFRTDMYPAQQFFPEDIISATVGSSGQFTLRRRMDSGFVFKVRAGGVDSNTVEVPIIAKPSLQLSASGNNVSASVLADPGQPGLAAGLQRWSGSTWVTVSSGHTDESATYATVATGEPGGQQFYRAFAGPDDANFVRLGYSDTVSVTLSGSGGQNPPPTSTSPVTTPPTTPPTTRPTTPPTTPPTTRPTTPPTTPPTTRPTTPPTTKPPTTTPTVKPTPTATRPPVVPKPPVFTGPKVGDVKFTFAYYNAKGSDTRSNTSLNREYVRITNKTKKTINLRYWTIRDRAGNTYKFTGNFPLAAGKSVYLRTGKGKNTSTTRYWGRKSHVWNNTGDTAYVRTGAYKLIDYCKWGKGRGYTSC